MPNLNLHLIRCQSSQHGIFCLGDQGIEDLSDTDSRELLKSVQALTDAQVEYVSPLLWRINKINKGLKTTKLKKIINKEMRDFMPTGTASPEWKRWMTEIQMTFHDHGVNQRRVDSGLGSVDSLWLEVKGIF